MVRHPIGKSPVAIGLIKSAGTVILIKQLDPLAQLLLEGVLRPSL